MTKVGRLLDDHKKKRKHARGSAYRKELYMIRTETKKMMAGLLAVLMLASTLFAIIPPVKANAANLIVTIDPGHGGSDPGNTSARAFGGASEAEHTWSLANHVRTRLQQYGITVYFTRGQNENPSLSARAATAGSYGSDMFLSIHTNSYSSSSAHGVEVLIPNNNWRPAIGQASRAAATIVLNKIVAETGVSSRGLLVKNGSGTYADGSATDYYGIIRGGKQQNIPVVMLVETGFASNQGDYLALLATDALRQRAAYAIADGVAQYYGLSLGPNVVACYNDELRMMDDAGTHVDNAYTPGQYDAWNKVVTFAEGDVATLVDWGWACFTGVSSHQYGYIVNGTEMFSGAFTQPLGSAENTAMSTMGGTSGSRFMGQLSASLLHVGSNSVKFCVRLNGTETVVLREYTVNVEPYVAPSADGSYATFDFTNKTMAQIQSMLRVEEHSGVIGNDLSVSAVDGVARFTATGTDPYAVLLNKDGNGTDVLGITGKQARYILMKYRTAAKSQAQPKMAVYTNLEVGIQWGHEESFTTTELNNDGTWNYVLVDTYKQFGKWNSNMQATRIDFLDVATAGEFIDVACIKTFSRLTSVQDYLVAEMNGGNTTAHEFLAANYPSLSPTTPPVDVPTIPEDTTAPEDTTTEPEDTTTPPEVEILVGDVTNDGSINSKDLTRLKKYLSSNFDGSVEVAVPESADTNGDELVNVKDLTRLKKYLSTNDGSVQLG